MVSFNRNEAKVVSQKGEAMDKELIYCLQEIEKNHENTIELVSEAKVLISTIRELLYSETGMDAYRIFSQMLSMLTRTMNGIHAQSTCTDSICKEATAYLEGGQHDPVSD